MPSGVRRIFGRIPRGVTLTLRSSIMRLMTDILSHPTPHPHYQDSGYHASSDSTKSTLWSSPWRQIPNTNRHLSVTPLRNLRTPRPRHHTKPSPDLKMICSVVPDRRMTTSQMTSRSVIQCAVAHTDVSNADMTVVWRLGGRGYPPHSYAIHSQSLCNLVSSRKAASSL